MSIIFGPIRQIAMVVRDADATMKEWSENLGVGPFFVIRNFVVEEFSYRGKNSPAPVLTLCFAQSGNVQIEIIQQQNDSPSAYQDFLKSGGEGVQHVCSWCETPEAYTVKRAELLERGLELIHEGESKTPRVRFAYFKTALPGGLMFEISEALVPELRAFTEMVAQSGNTWDGSHPIRDPQDGQQ